MYLKKLIKGLKVRLIYLLVLLVNNITFSAEYFPRLLSTNTNWSKAELNVTFIICTSKNEDFKKLDNKSIRSSLNNINMDIVKFTSSNTYLPNKLFFVLDKSGSMKKNNYFNLGVEKIDKIIKNYGESTVGALVMASDSIKYFTDIMGDYKKIVASNPGGNTRVYDGIYTALNHINNGLLGIPGIIVMTDGEDLHSKYTISDCLRLIEKLKVPIYVYLFGQPQEKHRKELERLTDLSYGHLFMSDDAVILLAKYFPQRGTIYNLNLKLPKIIDDKWQDLKLELLLDNHILVLHKNLKLKIPKDESIHKSSELLKGKIMYIVIGLLFVALISIVIWFAHRNATTKICPFCSKRYNINEENCPYCHQNTMYFYEKNTSDEFDISDGNIDLNGELINSKNSFKAPIIDNLNATKIMEPISNTTEMDKTVILDDSLPVLAYLIIKKGDRIGKEYPLRAGMNTVGRNSQNDICIEDKAISHSHAKIFWKDDKEGFVINDLASTNGTFVNDVEIVQQELKDKDIIKIGQTEFTFIHIS